MKVELLKGHQFCTGHVCDVVRVSNGGLAAVASTVAGLSIPGHARSVAEMAAERLELNAGAIFAALMEYAA